MKLVSWNVNGLRAIQKKGFEEYLQQSNADIFSLCCDCHSYITRISNHMQM